ncbi:hypothetical protein [Candidatus Chlorohelix sp.]|uniref:hypothetical protein n=1 Tax=Candidatus Chlorohelix sp. TaxID=3139201 RepID=UPI00304A9AD9
MSNNTARPYVATAAVNDSADLLILLNKIVAQIEESYWAALESSFEICLEKGKLQLPKNATLTRGRLFWDAAEVRFRYDGSLPNKSYRLTLVADTPLLQIISEFTDISGTLPQDNWQVPVRFERLLWGKPLVTAEEQAIGFQAIFARGFW